MIEFAGKSRPCYWPLAALEEYAELLNVSFGESIRKVYPTKLLYIGLKWGALAEGKDFEMTLVDVQLEFENCKIGLAELTEWYASDLKPHVERITEKKTMAGTRKK